MFSAIWIKKHLALEIDPGRIWYNYRDTCIIYENSYFARINYIWFNAVKHKYVKEASEWKFGSFYHRMKEGDEVKRIIEQYPWDRINVKDDF
jgi:hypothetical protein